MLSAAEVLIVLVFALILLAAVIGVGIAMTMLVRRAARGGARDVRPSDGPPARDDRPQH